MRIKTTTNCGSMFIVVLVAFSTMRDNSFAAPVMPPATTMELWGATWQVDGALVWTNDTALNRYVRYPFPIPLGRGVVPVYLTSGEISHASYSIEAFVRIPPGSLSIDFGVSGTNAFYRINLSPARNGRQMSRSVQFGGKPAEGEWPCTMPAPRFTADNISPVLDEDQRIRLENDFTEMPEVGIAGTWHRVRAEVRPETVTLYVDGLLQGSGPNKLEGKGAVRITMNGTVSVDSFEIKPLPALAQQFTTAPLDGLVNASSFVDRDSLKSDKAGFVNVGGVPFLLPSVEAGRDHVDVGVSLYRYNRQWGYDPASKPTTTYIGPQAYDPSELKFYVPHASYSRVWILAAADGERDSTPILTVRFFKPGIGWEVDSARAVPEWAATNAPSYARRVDVVMKDGKPGFLWAIPIDIDSGALAGDFRDQGLLMAVELTKQTYDFVAYPDPCSYGSFQGGLPSSARVYGVTFEKAPVSAYGTGEQRGNLYPYPEKAKWFVEVKSQSAKEEKISVKVRSEGPLGTVFEKQQEVSVKPGEDKRVEFAPETKEYGLYKVKTEVSSRGWKQKRDGTFLMLPSDKERKATSKTSRFGIYNWGGAHGTESDPEVYLRQMRLLGCFVGAPHSATNRVKWGIAPGHHRIYGRGYQPWAKTNPPEKEGRNTVVTNTAANAAALMKEHPDTKYLNAFAEDSISLRMTHGLPPYVFGQPWFTYDERERERVTGYFNTAQAVAEGTRKGAPDAEFIFGHCSPSFFLAFFREPGWNNDWFDGVGLDQPQFERMPERPPRATEPSSLYFLHKEMKDRGMGDKKLVHLESYFPSSHPLALGHRRQADSIVRTAALGMSWGSTDFVDTWSLHDCSGQWGSQHYGCVGLIGRAPEYNPKPAAAAYATMSLVLDLAEYDGTVDTGSRSAYCLRFKDPDGARLVYPAWTIRGKRPLKLSFSSGSEAKTVDENGNEKVLDTAAGETAVELSQTPVWIVVRKGAIEKAEVGLSVYDEAPGPNTVVLEDFEKADWSYSPNPYVPYASNHWDVVRETVAMTSQRVQSGERGGTSTVWRVSIDEIPTNKPMVGFYGVFTPPRAINIPGKAQALGWMGRGNSAWNRIAFELQDAKGEYWRSIGTKNVFNCDDIQSRSYFNFDGWRYMEFPLPGTLPADNYREMDTVWWGHTDGDGIVDLPLRLTRVFIETRPEQIYADQMLPITDSAVEIDDLVAVYGSPEMMTEEPVKVQRSAARLFMPRSRGGKGIPNPISTLATDGVGAAPEIINFEPPAQQNDGTRVSVTVKQVPSAKQYKVWVSAYPDGKGAKAMATLDAPAGGAAPELAIRGLKPSQKFYFYATYIDADGKESKPSKVRETVLKDEFPMK